MLTTVKNWAKQLKKQLLVLYFSCKDPRCPWVARLFTAFVVAYAFSPIDLIPDFIPILGYLDDVILLPLGILVALKLIPGNILDEAKSKVENTNPNDKPQNWMMGTVIIFIWIVISVYLFYIAFHVIY